MWRLAVGAAQEMLDKSMSFDDFRRACMPVIEYHHHHHHINNNNTTITITILLFAG